MADQGSVIFDGKGELQAARPRRSLLASVAVHLVLMVALFRGRTPIFVAPSSALGGANGRSITHLYWANGTGPADSPTASNSSSRAAAKSRITWNRTGKAGLAFNRNQAGLDVTDKHEELASAERPAPSAGSPYGSLSEGADAGHEIRPALPAVTAEPLVGPADLRDGVEGNVVVEITIDETGHVVSKVVVQSLGPSIDEKVMAALDNWTFRPATRDGVPIPSKQDVVYHFKPR